MMKLIKPVIYLFAVSMLVCSCGWKSSGKLLPDAERAMQTSLDSANRILDNIAYPEHLQGEKQADYCRMKATCCAFLFFQWAKADSLNNIALDYYRQMNDTADLKKVLYLSGQIYLNTKEPDKAIRQFSELENMAFHDSDFRLQAQFNYLLSLCYSDKGEYGDALRFSRKALACAGDQDSIQRAVYYRETAAIHVRMNAVDSALAYYRKALDMLREQEQLTRYSSLICNEISQTLLSNREYKGALEYAEKSMQYRANRKDATLFNLVKARIFIALNQTDSARFYLNLTIESSQNSYVTTMAYQHLSDLYRTAGNYEQAFYKTLNYNDFFERAQNIIEQNILSRQYQELQLENENNTLKLAKQKWEIVLLSFIFLAGIAAVVLWQWFSLVKKKAKMREQQQREQELRNQATIAEQEKELSQLREKSAVLRESLFRKLAVSEKIPSLDISGNRISESNHKKIALEESDWNELVETVDEVFGGFSTRLRKAYPHLSVDDIRFCCLLKINISMQDLADIYCISKAGVTKRKMRMKKEKFNITGDQTDLNDFLMRY